MPLPSREGALADLLGSLYDAPGLRRLLRRGPDGEDVSNELPAELAQPAELAHQAVLVLLRRGLVNQDLFDRLRVDRPKRAVEIDAVHKLWSGHLQPSPPVRVLRSARPMLFAVAALVLLIVGWALLWRDRMATSPATHVPTPTSAALAPAEPASTPPPVQNPTPSPAPTSTPTSTIIPSSASTVTIKSNGQGSTAVGGNLKASADQVVIDARDGATGVKKDATITAPNASVTATGGATGIEGDAVFEAK